MTFYAFIVGHGMHVQLASLMVRGAEFSCLLQHTLLAVYDSQSRICVAELPELAICWELHSDRRFG